MEIPCHLLPDFIIDKYQKIKDTVYTSVKKFFLLMKNIEYEKNKKHKTPNMDKVGTTSCSNEKQGYIFRK